MCFFHFHTSSSILHIISSLFSSLWWMMITLTRCVYGHYLLYGCQWVAPLQSLVFQVLCGPQAACLFILVCCALDKWLAAIKGPMDTSSNTKWEHEEDESRTRAKDKQLSLPHIFFICHPTSREANYEEGHTASERHSLSSWLCRSLQTRLYGKTGEIKKQHLDKQKQKRER